MLLEMFLVLLSALSGSNARQLQALVLPPAWPEKFEVSYTLEVPYIASLQPNGLKYPVDVVYDGPEASASISVYDDLDVTYFLPSMMYNVYPRISELVCDCVNETAGPTALRDSNTILPPPLPDISAWVYAGEEHIPGKDSASHVWQLTQRNGEKVSTYTFHVSKKGKPQLLHMVGVNLFTGSHYDQYEITFTHFKPLDDSHKLRDALQPPKLCRGVTPQAPSNTHHARKLQALSVLPSALVPAAASSSQHANPSSDHSSGSSGSGHSIHADDASKGAATASSWLLTWKERIASTLAGLMGSSSSSSSMLGAKEQQRVQADLAFIADWNAKAEQRVGSTKGSTQLGTPTFKMAANKFLPMPDEQWRATALGRRSEQAKKGSKRLADSARLEPFQRVLSDDQLPKAVDWRGTGADGPVKDQVNCGSCWAFATTGAMTGAWFLATGSSVSLSEQQLVDCSWDSGEYGNNGCGGGWPESALSYAAAAGMAGETDYKYLGANSFCGENKTEKLAMFKGFRSVPTKDEKAMMEAVARHGPIAISYDAADITMKYYSEGVYYRETCGTTPNDLDHAVTLVGYGTTADGIDYWLLRNSWSVLWGDAGYFKVARKGNDCGISVDGVIAVVDKEAAKAARVPNAAQRIAAARQQAIQGDPIAAAAAVMA